MPRPVSGVIIQEKLMRRRTAKDALAGLEQKVEERQALFIALKRSIALEQLVPNIWWRAVGPVRTQWLAPAGLEYDRQRRRPGWEQLLLFVVKFTHCAGDGNIATRTFAYSDVPAVLGGGKRDG